MQKRLSLTMAAAGFAAACGAEPTPPTSPNATGPVGAIMLSAEIDAPGVTRVAYTVTAPDLAAPMVGEIGVADGVAVAQLSVPAGEHRSLEVSYRNADGTVCQAKAGDLVVDTGRTAQLILIPSCGDAQGDTRAANKPPKIEAIFSTRRSVAVGDPVAVTVFATDHNNDPLSYRWTENIAGFGFDNSRRQLALWKAGPGAVAQNRLTITVNDGRGGSVSRSMVMDFDGVARGPGTCATPTPIKLGERVRGFTVGGTSAHSSEGCSVAAGTPEHVFRLDLATTQDISASTAGSAFFARVYIRRADCAAGADLACDQFSQRADIRAAEPGTYFIIVDGDSPFAQGEFQLSVFSGTQPEECRNFADDDGDGAFDCADSDCAGNAGCLECAFTCDPNPSDCLGGECDRFSGRCNTFFRFGQECDTDSNPATAEVCGGEGRCVPNTAVCGNGIVENNEQCDDGNVIDGDSCTSACLVNAVCGNGLIELGEDCDDGNLLAGDGCGPNCRIEQCGQISCEDFNPCTTNVCTDPNTSTCTSTNVADGTVCELDGSPETAESCQAGACQPPAPDTALIILDPAVLADPAFSLLAMHNRLSPNGDGAAQFAEWATTLTAPMTTNGRTVEGRPGFTAYFQGIPRDSAGRIDVDAAGFLPSALVNRFDLRQPGNCGENRLVFTKTTGATDGSDRGTLIFEFNVPDDGSNCAHALAPWLALRNLQGDALRAAAVGILEDFAVPQNLNQFRTNEFVNSPVWELREFHLVDGQLQPFPVLDSVPPELAQDPTFRQFVVQNSFMINHGAREIGMIPTVFLAGSSQANGSIVNIGNIVPSLPGLQANLNILSCSGCHLTETGTAFVHIVERQANRPSALSNFMRSELEFRFGDLERFIAAQP